MDHPRFDLPVLAHAPTSLGALRYKRWRVLCPLECGEALRLLLAQRPGSPYEFPGRGGCIRRLLQLGRPHRGLPHGLALALRLVHRDLCGGVGKTSKTLLKEIDE